MQVIEIVRLAVLSSLTAVRKKKKTQRTVSFLRVDRTSPIVSRSVIRERLLRVGAIKVSTIYVLTWK